MAGKTDAGDAVSVDIKELKEMDVGQLVKQFGAVSKMAKQMANVGVRGQLKAAKEMARSGSMEGLMPGMGSMPGMAGLRTKGSTRSVSPKKRFKDRKKRKR